MRVWDVDPRVLCDKHLKGEHGEIHAIWNIITLGHKGYSTHRETMRWRGKLPALKRRHDRTAKEMARRGIGHYSSLPARRKGGRVQRKYVNSLAEQMEILRDKPCGCPITGKGGKP